MSYRTITILRIVLFFLITLALGALYLAASNELRVPYAALVYFGGFVSLAALFSIQERRA